MTDRLCYTLLILGLLCSCFCACPGHSWFVETPFYLVAGWGFFLVRAARETEVDGPMVALAATGLALLTPVVHVAGCWYRTRRPETPPWRWRTTFALVGMLAAVALAGGASLGIGVQTVGIVTSKEPLLRGYFEASNRIQSTNNLKNIGLAVHGFHDSKHHLPPGSTFDSQGRGLHGWQTFLLPYIDQAPLFQQIALDQPWNAPHNNPHAKVAVYPYQSPMFHLMAKSQGYALTHYAANVHLLLPTPMKMTDVTDGSSNTMLAGEVAKNFQPGAKPGNWRDPMRGINRAPDGFGSTHQRKLAIIVMLDGSARAVRENVSLDVLRAISTPRGGENFNLEDLD